MGKLDELEPKAVMRWFEEISSVPRGSMKEKKITAYIMKFAADRGLACSKDACGNVLVRKPASPGYEKRGALVLQSHMDMVCAKKKGVTHNFECEGLDLWVDGDRIKARGTTLGADNGIGVAYQLAILDDTVAPHPAIEAVFTVGEEIGMVGAVHFNMSQLTGKTMINFDAGGFTEGRIYVGCAGNQHAVLTQKLTYVTRTVGSHAVRITVSGLHGGHSGGDIDKGRGNASVIMGRLMALLLADGSTAVASFESGDTSQENKNGIPSQSAIVACTEDLQKLKDVVSGFEAVLKDELSDVDDGVTLELAERKMLPERVLSYASAHLTSQLLLVLPNGVRSMQRIFPDTPECSCNVGNVEMQGQEAAFYLSVRSCKSSLIDRICDEYRAVAALTDCKLHFDDRLPGWDYDKNSRIKSLVEAEYQKEFGRSPRFKVTHASTECAIFKEQIPDMDIISMGPIIYEEHTPEEYMGIASVGVLWKFVQNVIKEL